MSKGSSSGFDPALAQLFASSVGPAPKIRQTTPPNATISIPNPNRHNEEDGDSNVSSGESFTANDQAPVNTNPRKRRRKTSDKDDVEIRYMRHLELQELKEHDQNSATKAGRGSRMDEKPQDVGVVDIGEVSETPAIEESTRRTRQSGEPPRHETVESDHNDTGVEKASRTIFLSNVSTSAITSKSANKVLMNHLASFIPSLNQSETQHGIESFRFRSTAFAESGMPRKAAFIRQELMDTTTKSTNAYAVFTTQLAAREAVKRLNGTMVLDRHLGVDSVAHPAQQDHRRSVFVGNLNFVDDTTNMDAAEDAESGSKPRKGKDPADVEEGLWRQFGKAGRVESVRVVRDKTTRVGKGFAYVKFFDANTVEKALSFNGKKFPPMLPRILRVTRAKSVTKTKMQETKPKHYGQKSSFKGDMRSQESSKESKSFGGRGNKLLGRAGAAQSVGRKTGSLKAKRPTKSGSRRAESFKKKAKQK